MPPRLSAPVRFRLLIPMLILGLALPLLGAGAASAQSGCIASGDAQIYALIDTLRTAGNAIAIDGNDADWVAFPIFDDAADDLVANPGQEIVAGAIAPMADRLKFFARTLGAPNQTDGAFGVSIEAVGGAALDAQIILNPVSGFHVVVLFDAENNPILPPAGVISDASFEIAFGADFLEIEIPYALLTPFLPDLALPTQRSWVRGGVGSLSGAGAVIDYGPGTTSYRLITTPYALDPALPAPTNPALDMSLPLQGQWMVIQGAFGAFSHSTYWAYDFAVVDSSFNRSDPAGSLSNADYYAFGEPLFAPIDGTITDAIGSNPDVPPLNPMAAPYNLVEIDPGGGLLVSLVHEKQNSLTVNTSDVVSVGDQIGEVGNSGYTTTAHVHLEVDEAASPVIGTSVRGVRLERVIVSLNAYPDDPWARRCATWDIREGFIVEALPPPVPALSPLGIGVGLALWAGAGSLALRRRSRENRLSKTGSEVGSASRGGF